MRGQAAVTARRARDRAAVEVQQKIHQDRLQASERVAKLLTYLEEHLFDTGLNVDVMKRACGIRDNSIVVAFHRELGETPKLYITARRMEVAVRLLWGTELKVWQVGAVVGYSSLGVFSKAFYRWAGQRPVAFRKRRLDDTAAPSLPAAELCRRAVAGQLEGTEARRLLFLLHQLYPGSVPGLQP